MPRRKKASSELNQVRDVLGSAAKMVQKVLEERERLRARIAELDSVLAMFPSSLRGGSAPATPSAAPKAAPTGARRGRRPKGSSVKTVREVVLASLSKSKPLTFAEIMQVVSRERPDVKKGSVAPIVAQLREAGEVKVTGKPRDYRYTRK